MGSHWWLHKAFLLPHDFEVVRRPSSRNFLESTSWKIKSTWTTYFSSTLETDTNRFVHTATFKLPLVNCSCPHNTGSYLVRIKYAGERWINICRIVDTVQRYQIISSSLEEAPRKYHRWVSIVAFCPSAASDLKFTALNIVHWVRGVGVDLHHPGFSCVLPPMSTNVFPVTSALSFCSVS